VSITNMTRLEKRPESMPAGGPTLVLGYMKQFRANFMLDAPTGRLMLFGRQVRRPAPARARVSKLQDSTRATQRHQACRCAVHLMQGGLIRSSGGLIQV
jgi:hypothetical protein